MARVLLAAVCAVSFAAFAQTAPPSPSGAQQPGAEAATPAPASVTPAPPPAAAAPAPSSEAEFEAKLEQAKKEMREEIRAQVATQSAAHSWEQEWTEERRKLELFTLDGYYRVRPELLNKLDLNREADPGNNFLFPRVGNHRTAAGANMRLRLNPTLNVSEEVRIKMQVDALDNLVMGATPDYAFALSNRYDFSVLSMTQVPPRSAINSAIDSIMVKRLYGEVSTPVGILRFGRMGSHWGLGMLYNDGNCFDCDYGDTVDRIQFVAEPVPGWYIAPMVDFNIEGLTSKRASQGQPFDLTNADDAHSFILAIARRDTEQKTRARLENGQSVFNFGLHFTYRTQRFDATQYLNAAYAQEGGEASGLLLVPRSANVFIPDFWVKYERKSFRIELELAGLLGTLGNRALTQAEASNLATNQMLRLMQFGAVLQTEFRLVDNRLKILAELGYASGDKAYALGNQPSRVGSGNGGNTARGDIEGRQFICNDLSCPDRNISNFRFNRDYRIDSILWREILGGLTDVFYVKPGIRYDIADGFAIYGGATYSRTIFRQSSPHGGDPNLGVEINAGLSYETDDGFLTGVNWALLIPMRGLETSNSATGVPPSLDSAQAIRAFLGIKF